MSKQSVQLEGETHDGHTIETEHDEAHKRSPHNPVWGTVCVRLDAVRVEQPAGVEVGCQVGSTRTSASMPPSPPTALNIIAIFQESTWFDMLTLYVDETSGGRKIR